MRQWHENPGKGWRVMAPSPSAGKLWLVVRGVNRNLKLPPTIHSENRAIMSTFGSPGGRQINSKPTP